MVYDPPVTANAMDAYAAPPVIRDEEADYGNTASARGPWSSVFASLQPITCITGGFRDQCHTTTCQKEVVCTLHGIRGAPRAEKLVYRMQPFCSIVEACQSEGCDLRNPCADWS